MKVNWGTGAAAAYIAFAVATSGFVAFAMHRPVTLVRADYYDASLREDQRIAARARGHASRAAVTVSDEAIVVSIPAAQCAAARGTVTLYRASDARADRTFTLAPDRDGRQELRARGLPRGHWIVKLQWRCSGADFDLEQPVLLR